MISVHQARQRAADQLSKKAVLWALDDMGSPLLTIALRPPTEREVLLDQGGAESWVRAWATATLDEGAAVEWEERVWLRVGRQRVPVRVVLTDGDAVAAFARGAQADRWRRLRRRVATLRSILGSSEALDRAVRRHATEISKWDEARFERVIDVVRWVTTHPTTGLRPRQVPVRGVDSKWLTSHRSVVTSLHSAVTGSTGLGLLDADRTVRVRFLDQALAPGGLSDVATPASALATLAIAPRVVFVFENLESVLAMPPWPGAVVIHGSGYAVDVIRELPWVLAAPILYWGDLDSHGFSILHRLRGHHLGVRSVLMDESTLVAHRDLWVAEPQPTRADVPALTETEHTALQRLRTEGDVRLEQERIPWAIALRELQAAAAQISAH